MICTKQKTSSPSIYGRTSERDWITTGRSGKGFRAGSSMRWSDYFTFMVNKMTVNGNILAIIYFNRFLYEKP